MRLMNVLKSAAQGYGTERRIILLHGPVGSAKSTIARQLKKGIEEYSRTPDGALYTYYWNLPGALSELAGGSEVFHSPMHDEPLRLIPREWREDDDQQARARQRRLPGQDRRRRQPGVPPHLQGADAPLRRQLREGDDARARAPPRALASRTASASARSSPRTRRTRTRPSSPATSTTARSRRSDRTPIRARSTSTASSTSPTAASSSSSRS